VNELGIAHRYEFPDNHTTVDYRMGRELASFSPRRCRRDRRQFATSVRGH
jgi:hypothetical protein